MMSTPTVNSTFELPMPSLGIWREGNTGTEGVWRFEAPRPGRHVMVSALVHGNELCGAWALLGALQAGLRPVAGSLTLAFCNLAAFDRFDPARVDDSRFVDEDFNRVWGPGLAARGASSTERTRALALQPFVESADWLLDLHSMHDPGMPLLLTGLQPRNIALARELGTPAMVIVDAGHAEGKRMRDHGRFGEPASGEAPAQQACALLVECGYHGALSSRAVAFDVMARFLDASGAVPAAVQPAHWRLALPPQQRVLAVTHAIAARSMAVSFSEPWSTGQTVAKAGTLLGWNDGEPIVTPYDDCTLVMPSLRQLRPGVTVVRLARDWEDSAVEPRGNF
jgi:predicted deacylase